MVFMVFIWDSGFQGFCGGQGLEHHCGESPPSDFGVVACRRDATCVWASIVVKTVLNTVSHLLPHEKRFGRRLLPTERVFVFLEDVLSADQNALRRKWQQRCSATSKCAHCLTIVPLV